jgi:rubredoxin
MDYQVDWTCENCGGQFRTFFKTEAVRGLHFREHDVICPDCEQPRGFIPEAYRVEQRGNVP